MREVQMLPTFWDVTRIAAGCESVNGTERYLRKRPILVADLSGHDIAHQLQKWVPVETSRTLMCSFNDASVRGVETIITQDHILTRYQHGDDSHLRLYATGQGGQFGSPDMGLRRDGNRIFVEPQDEIVLQGDHALISPEEAYNYGMWLLQVIPYLDYLRQGEYHGRLLCFADAPWQPAFLDFMGIGDRLVLQKKGRAYRIQGRLTAFRHDYRNLVLSARDREAFARLKRRPDVARRALAHEAIFVSRRTRSVANPHYRALQNEDELLDGVRRLGIHVIEPEYLTFAEQISLFAQARVVVGLGGAGMFNTVFCEEGTRVVSIESSNTWIEAHANLFASAGMDYAVIFGRQDLSVTDTPQKPWTLDVPRAIEAIRSVL